MRWIIRGFMIALLALIFVAGGGQAVLQLWNWLAPNIFGWRTITFWQAVGLLALCRILFGNFGGRPLWRHRMAQRWQRMTPEEREKFRAGMQDRCGHFGASATESKA